MAFTEAQIKSLEAKLDAKHVRTRRVQDIVLTYVEGWHVIAEANRIFGYDAWDRETIATPLCVDRNGQPAAFSGIHGKGQDCRESQRKHDPARGLRQWRREGSHTRRGS